MRFGLKAHHIFDAFRSSSTVKRPKMLMETETSENAKEKNRELVGKLGKIVVNGGEYPRIISLLFTLQLVFVLE